MDGKTNLADINRSLNCGGCGALLHFEPGTHSLKCDYCGQSNAIQSDNDSREITSYDFDEFVAGIDTEKQGNNLKVVDCTNCGSQTLLDQYVSSDKCPFCTAPLVLNMTGGQQYVQPHYVLPFEVTKQQGIRFFNKWISNLWWSPNDLEKKVNGSTSILTGVYLPHWTYDTDTITDYTGERGDYYYTEETYTETVNGRTETKTRRVRHTSWSYASGTVYADFRDVMVPASQSLKAETLTKLEPWKLEMLVPFDERYMSGFRSETYQVDPKQGFISATEYMNGPIRSKIKDDIGGDEQRIDHTDTAYNNKALKYLVLPVWLSAYNYNNKVYQFTINASTGEVIGQRPLSWIKITLAILFVLMVIAGIVFYFQQANAGV